MKEKFAFISFVLGITSLLMGCAQLVGNFYLSTINTSIQWISPSATFIGLIFGVFGLKSARKNLAKLGIVLCIIGLLCSIILVPL